MQQTYDDYCVYVMRQASRRSWRIGQKRPVNVVFISYRNALQADALKLVAKKLQGSLAVEGELPEEGLAAYGDDGDDLMMALACQIVGGEEEDTAETMEEVFAAVRDAEATAEELLVDEHWKLVEIEPQAVEVNGNSHHSYGHDAIGPTVELVLGNGHVPANGNGGQREWPHGDAGERQWSPRGGRRAAAAAVFLGRVHGQGAGQAQGPQAEAQARNPLDVRVGADA